MFSVNVVVSLVNVLFFAVVQTLFYKYIGSRELDRTVKHKSSILRTVRENLEKNHLEAPVLLLDAAVLRAGVTKRQEARVKAAERNAANNRLIMRWIGPILFLLLLVIIALVLFNRKKDRSFEFAHWFGMALVVFVYVPEILFFFFVIERYQMVGDYELANGALQL